MAATESTCAGADALVAHRRGRADRARPVRRRAVVARRCSGPSWPSAPHATTGWRCDGERTWSGYAGLCVYGRRRPGCRTSRSARDRQGQGLGRRLLDDLLAEAARRARAQVLLEVRADNEPGAAAVRSRADSSRSAVRRGYYQPSNTDALVMRARGGAAVPDEPLVLGIETSCDETGVGIVRGHTAARRRGGVQRRPARPVRRGGARGGQPRAPGGDGADRAAARSTTPASTLSDVDAIAVTAGPGLAGALLVGVAAAKAYALALDKPLYGVNHLAAHVAVDTLEHGPLPEPAVALLVSGGHSSLLLVDDLAGDVTPLGATIDDAAGEAFDKVARLLGLPFPGGPPIDRAARDGDPAAIALPARPHRPARPGRAPVRLLVLRAQDGGGALGRGPAAGRRAGAVADVAASFQEAVVRRADREGDRRLPDAAASSTLLIGGGVAANSRLRALAARALRRGRHRAAGAPPEALHRQRAMVAALGSHLVAAGWWPTSSCSPTGSRSVSFRTVSRSPSTSSGSSGNVAVGIWANSSRQPGSSPK